MLLNYSVLTGVPLRDLEVYLWYYEVLVDKVPAYIFPAMKNLKEVAWELITS